MYRGIVSDGKGWIDTFMTVEGNRTVIAVGL